MNKKKLEAGLHELINSSLSKQADVIDVKTLGRLRRARVAAVASVQDKRKSWLGQIWSSVSAHSLMHAPVAQASVAMLVAVFSLSLFLVPGHPVGNNVVIGTEVQQNDQQALSEMDVLMSNEDMEFLENLEIYEWLAAEYG